MSLKKYLLYVKFLSVVVESLIIRILFETYQTRFISNSFYFHIYCLLFGVGCALTFFGISDLYDWYPFDPLLLSSDQIYPFNTDCKTFEKIADDLTNIEITEEVLKKDKEEIKNAKKNLCIWLVGTAVLYCVLIYSVS